MYIYVLMGHLGSLFCCMFTEKLLLLQLINVHCETITVCVWRPIGKEKQVVL